MGTCFSGTLSRVHGPRSCDPCHPIPNDIDIFFILTQIIPFILKLCEIRIKNHSAICSIRLLLLIIIFVSFNRLSLTLMLHFWSRGSAWCGINSDQPTNPILEHKKQMDTWQCFHIKAFSKNVIFANIFKNINIMIA